MKLTLKAIERELDRLDLTAENMEYQIDTPVHADTVDVMYEYAEQDWCTITGIRAILASGDYDG